MSTTFDYNGKSLVVKFEKVLELLQLHSSKALPDDMPFLLDKVLDHLSSLDNEGYNLFMESSPIRLYLSNIFNVFKALTTQSSILTFSLKFFAELLKTEERFLKVTSTIPDVLENISKISRTTIIERLEINHSILNLIFSLASLKSGRDWIFSSDIVHFIILSLGVKTVFIRKRACEIINLLLASNTEDSESKGRLIKLMMEGLSKFSTLSDVGTNKTYELESYLTVLGNYVENSLSNSNQHSVGPDLLLLNVEELCLRVAQLTENESILVKVCSLLNGVYASCSVDNSLPQKEDWERKTMAVIQLILSRGYVRSALTVISQSLFLWSCLRQHDQFILQLIYLMVGPIMIGTEETSEHFEDYQTHMLLWKQAVPVKALEISEKLTSMLINNNELNELTVIALSGLRRSMKNLGKENALKVTRSSIYLLGCLKSPESRRVVQLSSSPRLAIELTGALCSFIEVYNISWWESYETICLPGLCAKLVVFSACRNAQVTCAALQGIRFCIKQFLHPDQALLLNANRKESTMNEISAVVLNCFVSHHWEVRDSALQVTLEMTELSQHRYPDFQELLKTSGLLKAAVSAVNDSESYVRAFALSVIAAATPVASLWEQMNENINVATCCYSVLQNDSEALARRAAVKTLMSIAASEHALMVQDRAVIYRVLSSAALSDLDWEVKSLALDFWGKTIQDSLSRQGMLDNHFPEYVFSKEKQKIVRMDHHQVRASLQEVLKELGSCGCLYVLLQSVDDCDLSVKRKSLELLSQLRDILVDHNVIDLLAPPISHFHSPSNDQPVMTPNNSIDEANSDRVIDEILSVNDISLVADILVDTHVSDPSPTGDLSPVKAMKAQDFVSEMMGLQWQTMLQATQLSSDLHVSNLDSLIDDLEGCLNDDGERLGFDCY